MNNLAEWLRCDNLVTPQDVPVAGAVNTNANMYRDMRLYRKGLVVVQAHLTAGFTAIAQLVCASDAAGTGVQNVAGSTVTLTGVAGALEQVGVIAFDVSQLIAVGATLQWVGVTITTNNNGDDIAAALIREAGRYMSATMPDR